MRAVSKMRAPLLLMNHRRGLLFVPVQECEIIRSVSVGDVAPLVTPAHPASALKRQALGEPEGAVPSLVESISVTSLGKKATFTINYASSTLTNVLLRLPAWQTHHSSTC